MRSFRVFLIQNFKDPYFLAVGSRFHNGKASILHFLPQNPDSITKIHRSDPDRVRIRRIRSGSNPDPFLLDPLVSNHDSLVSTKIFEQIGH